MSVVITNHDYEEFVADAIESALRQDHHDVEVIVVDDGSTDGSQQVIDRFRDSVTIVWTTNGGQGHAINCGFAVSTGDVVIFLDADDRLHRSTARRVADAFDRRPDLSRVQIPLSVIDEHGVATGNSLPPAGKPLFTGDARPRLLSCPDDIAWQPTSGNAFARHALERVLPMDPLPYRLCADYHLSTLVPLHGPVHALDEAGGDYRIHGGNGHIRRTTLDRVRADVRRTVTTRASLIDAARELGYPGLPDDPTAVASISHSALRAVSFRFGPSTHPVTSDTRFDLALLGVRSARARRDLAWSRRIGASVWTVALLVLPRPLVRRLARPVLDGALTT